MALNANASADDVLSDYNYDLPDERIAQIPLANRDSSKLLILNRQSGSISHRVFTDIADALNPGDLLVLNNTRVTAMRIFVERNDVLGKPIELFLIGRLAGGSGDNEQMWHALAKPAKRMLPGVTLDTQSGLRISVVEKTDDRGGRLIKIAAGASVNIEQELRNRSLAPLPPYIKTALRGEESERYQTVYAERGGSAAAPTAGLHFTPDLLNRLALTGIAMAHVTLHIGLGTFRPIETEHIKDHKMHTERFAISQETADAVNNAKGRVIAVGTTSARSLEASADADGVISARDAETDLFITPGYEFKVVDSLITNFHMPRSTLLVLVSAFAGKHNIMRAYREAMEENYRFLSFGDAMFIE